MSSNSELKELMKSFTDNEISNIISSSSYKELLNKVTCIVDSRNKNINEVKYV